MSSPWDDVLGQDRAVALLRRAADHPVHAYLLVGPPGSGIEQATRTFAAELIGTGGAPDVVGRVLRGRHPDVVEFTPTATTYSVREDVRDRIIPAATLSPVEADRRVLVLWEAERLHGNQDEPQHALLKTIEEPPPRTFLLLVTGAPDDLLPTVRSRCQRIDFSSLDDATVRDALDRDGVPEDAAVRAARLAGGRLDRARDLAGPRAALREAFVEATDELDGSGASVLRVVARLEDAIGADLDELRTRLEAEVEALEDELARSGYPDRTAQAMRRRLADAHRRRDRKSRTEALVEGVTALETVYRDALVPGGPARNVDRRPLEVDARSAAAALDACRDARDALAEHNPNETLLLERLVFHLPVAARGPGSGPA